MSVSTLSDKDYTRLCVRIQEKIGQHNVNWKQKSKIFKVPTSYGDINYKVRMESNIKTEQEKAK